MKHQRAAWLEDRAPTAILWSAIIPVCLWATAARAQFEVVLFSPPRHTLSSHVDTEIHIAFSQSLDPTTVSSRTFRAFGRWTGPIAGSLQVQGTQLTFIPDRALAAGDLITVTLADSLRAADGTSFRPGGYSQQFWTESQHVSALQYTPLASLTTGNPSRPYGGVATDLNNDGWLDITTVNEDSADLRVFMNRADGTGTFEPFTQPTFGVGNRASPSESADFNNDGNADITVANIDDNTISVVLGNGDGSFAPQQTISVGPIPRGIAVLDVDGDGDTDIVNTNFGNVDNLSLHINNGEGGFGAATPLTAGVAGVWSLAAGDMNSDGIFDLVTASGTRSQIRVLTGNGDGTFTEQAPQNAGGRSWQIVLGDVNGDGHLDVSSANARNDNGSILLGNGDGTLQFPTTYNVATMGTGGNGFPLATDLGDLDGDGDLDWIISSFNGDWVVMHNDGQGSFEFLAQLEAPSAASCSLMHDFDNDGDLDLGLIDELANVVIFHRNDGIAVAEGDFDADGDLDLDDIDALVARIIAREHQPLFDLTGDALVTDHDLESWLVLGGAANLPSGKAYLRGDGNLDGVVDVSDWNIWNDHKFTTSTAWSRGNYAVDNVVDVLDFNVWNTHKFRSSDTVAVPEPTTALWLWWGLLLVFIVIQGPPSHPSAVGR